MDSSTMTSASSEEKVERVEFKDFGCTVSEDGKVTREKNGREVPQRLSKHGYYRISLYHPVRKRPYTFLVHRLVAEFYVPNPEQRQVVNHKDGNKKNNHKDNLEWITLSENTQHALEFGLRTFNPRKGGKRDWRGRFSGWIQRNLKSTSNS